MSASFQVDPFVSIPLLATPTDYPAWSAQMRAFLESKDLWRVVADHTSPSDVLLWRASAAAVEQYDAWMQRRRLVGTYPKNKLSPAMRRAVEHTSDGTEIWSAVHSCCRPKEKPDFACKFRLGARLAACRGEEYSSTRDYAQAYGELMDLVEAAGITSEENRVIGFLVGLDDVFPDWVTIQVAQISQSGHLPALSDLAFEARVWEDMHSCREVRPAERNCAPTTFLERARENPRKHAARGKQKPREVDAMDMR